MTTKFMAFGVTEIKKRLFHYSKYPININNVDIDKIIESIKVSVGKKGFKYFIDFKDNEKFKPLCILPPNMGGYTKRFDETKCMSFLTKDNEFLEK